jgi:hypothetical protein
MISLLKYDSCEKRSEIEKKIQEESIINHGSLVVVPLRMKATTTRKKYRGRLAKFFDFIGMTGEGQFNANKNDTASGN